MSSGYANLDDVEASQSASTGGYYHDASAGAAGSAGSTGVAGKMRRHPVRSLAAFALLLVLVLVIVYVSTRKDPLYGPAGPYPSANASPAVKAQLKQMASMVDRNHDPCDNFYQFACNGWVQKQQETDYSYAFSGIIARVHEQQLQLLKENFPFIHEFYDECTDTNALDQRGLPNTLTNTIDTATAAVKDWPSFASQIGALQKQGLATQCALTTEVTQGLIDNDFQFFLEPAQTADYQYYVQTDPSIPVEQVWKGYFSIVMANVFSALGYSNAQATTFAKQVYDLDKAIAEAVGDLSVDGISGMLHNTTSLTIEDAAQQLQLGDYFKNLGVQDGTTVRVFYENKFRAMQAAVTKAGWDVAKHYIEWHVMFNSLSQLTAILRSNAHDLAKIGIQSSTYNMQWFHRQAARDAINGRLVNPRHAANLRRNTRLLSVSEEDALLVGDAQRQETCLNMVLATFADMLSHEWVKNDFPTKNLAPVRQLVDYIYTAMGHRLENVKWLDPVTRQSARYKWGNITRNIAYDSDWRHYRNLTLVDKFYEDTRAAIGWHIEFQLGKIGQYQNRHDFASRDIMIQNAYYDPQNNNINMLGGLIESPMVMSSLPLLFDIARYGYVIGHEITHGFDNSGRLFDETGRYRSWWQPASVQEFDRRTQCLVDQYSAFMSGGIHVNGQQTLGENIADSGGVNNAWDAYQTWVHANASNSERLSSTYTNDQLFWLHNAQTWCTKSSDESLRRQIHTDVHSPAEWRVVGALSNKREFAEAFHCSASSPMGRSLTSKQCVLW